MQVFSVKQHKQILINQFSLQLSKNLDLDRNLVKNNSKINEKTLVSCIFMGWKKNPTEIVYVGPFG